MIVSLLYLISEVIWIFICWFEKIQSFSNFQMWNLFEVSLHIFRSHEEKPSGKQIIQTNLLKWWESFTASPYRLTGLILTSELKTEPPLCHLFGCISVFIGSLEPSCHHVVGCPSHMEKPHWGERSHSSSQPQLTSRLAAITNCKP